MRHIIFFISLLLLNSSWLYAQNIQVHEIHIDALAPTLETYGADSIAVLLYDVPIWELDESIALEIVQKLDINSEQASINSHFILSISKFVQDDIVFEKLDSMIDREILDMKQKIESDQIISKFSKDLLISYQFQNSDLVYESLVLKLNELYGLLDLTKTRHKNNKRNFLRTLIHGLSNNQININYLTSNIHAILQVLNNIRPTEFPSDKIRETENSITSRYSSVFQKGISPIYLAEQPNSFKAKVIPRSEHYLFNKEGFIHHPAKQDSNIELHIFYSNTPKSIVREINAVSLGVVNLHSPVTLKTYIVYILDDEIIEMLYSQEIFL